MQLHGVHVQQALTKLLEMSPMGYRHVFSVLSATMLLAACSTVDRRIDPDDPDPVSGAVLRSQDIGSMADQMARDIIASGVLRSSDPQQRFSFHILRQPERA